MKDLTVKQYTFDQIALMTKDSETNSSRPTFINFSIVSSDHIITDKEETLFTSNIPVILTVKETRNNGKIDFSCSDEITSKIIGFCKWFFENSDKIDISAIKYNKILDKQFEVVVYENDLEENLFSEVIRKGI